MVVTSDHSASNEGAAHTVQESIAEQRRVRQAPFRRSQFLIGQA